jgi:transcriptional regulator with XRE-family HTH domain
MRTATGHGIMSDMSMYVRTDEGQIPEWSFCDRLRKARERAGLEQAALAALLGKKRSTVSNWERGTNRPDELALRAIAYHTNVRYDWLVTGMVTIGYQFTAAEGFGLAA